MIVVSDVFQKLSDVLSLARGSGADAAEAVFAQSDSLSVSWREGKIETLERSEGADIGVRVFIGKKQASCSGSALDRKALEEMAMRAVAMAKAAPEDPFCGLAAPEEISKHHPTLELADGFDVDAQSLIAAARAAEDAALSVKGVAQCESAGADASRAQFFLVTSNGFSGMSERTRYGLAVAALAGQGTEMEQDGEFSSVVFREDLPSPESVGNKAGEKAVRHLGARKMPTGKFPVVFDPQEASGLLGSFMSAIKGSSVARGTSFLKDCLSTRIFPKGVTVLDDPFMPKGLRSRPFDAEGLLPHPRAIVEDGVLKTWLLDLRSARQLGMKSTGHASRGTSGVPSPSPSNFFMKPGDRTPQALMADIKEGFYVTETMGMGVDDVTGDYSLAARGFWIENGMPGFPVSEMTIAGNLRNMFSELAVADDLVFRYGIDSPTLRIDGMTVA